MLHRELHADAAETAFQALVGFLGILRPEVAAVRVKLAEYERHGVLDERVHVDRIDVDVVDELQQVAHLVRARVDDVDAAAGEVVRVERADEDANDGADGNE